MRSQLGGHAHSDMLLCMSSKQAKVQQRKGKMWAVASAKAMKRALGLAMVALCAGVGVCLLQIRQGASAAAQVDTRTLLLHTEPAQGCCITSTQTSMHREASYILATCAQSPDKPGYVGTIAKCNIH